MRSTETSGEFLPGYTASYPRIFVVTVVRTPDLASDTSLGILTNSIEQNRSCQTTGSAPSQEIPRILLNPEVYHRITSPESDQSNAFSYPASCRFIVIFSFHLRLGLPSVLFPVGFPTQTLHDLITRIISGEQYRSWSCLLGSLLNNPVTSSLVGLNIFPITLISNILSPCSSTE